MQDSLTYDGKGNVEQEDRELTGAARSAHVLHITPRLGGEGARLVQSALAKIDDSQEPAAALLIIVGDRQSAYDLAALSRAEAGGHAPLIPLTISSRAARLLQRGPRAIVGTPGDLLALVRATALKVATLRHIVLLWPEALLTSEPHAADLETLLGETPRDADRTLIVDHVSQQLEAFIERMALKPRRLTHDVAPVRAPRAVSYVIVAAEQRAALLQRLVDARDAANFAVVADDARAAHEAAAALTTLGIDLPTDARVIAPPERADAALVVWYGAPASLERIAIILDSISDTSEVVLLATASELQRLRAFAGTLALAPLALPQRGDEASQRQRALREELAALLRREPMDAELATIEPLLGEHDAAEIAAAALRLLGRARLRSEQAAQEVAARTAPPPPSAQRLAPSAEQWTRLFLSVGERDGVRRGDLVGAITGEADIVGSQVGKIDLRDTYSLVDVASAVADRVVERLTGVSIRGRRVTVRPDRGGTRSGPPEGRRPPTRGELADAPDPGSRSRPRAAREHEEWSSRAERLRHARRPPGPPPEAPGSES